MALSATKKSSCATCGKAAALFSCRGCAKDFCVPHVAEHRQTLGKQMDEVTVDHDQLRQMIAECTAEPHRHPLMKQIDEWERQSIDKIRQAAEHSRQQLLTLVGKHTTHVKEALEQLKQQLSKARDDEEFFETDLEEWKKQLAELKKKLTAPTTINVRQEENVASFISKIIVGVSTDCFERPTGDIRVEDNGQLIVHGQTSGHALVRGRGEYSSGYHQFRFKIEQLGSSKWIFFGIVSKNAPMEAHLFKIPTTYGWAGYNQVFLNGVVHNPGFNNYKSDMQINDTLELLIDCDRQMLRLTNERTRSVHELNVDVTKCSFPWQLSLNLHDPNDRVHILSS